MAVKRVIEEKCLGCGLCAESCPADVFRLDAETKKAAAVYPMDCQLCLWCVSVCPAGAVELTGEIGYPCIRSWG